MTSTVKEFKQEREKLNEIGLKFAGKSIKRFFNLDARTYDDGALSKKFKELLGLVASTVLRCDDCIMYHLIQCYIEGVNTQEIEESLAITLVVGGSITIPHIRRAFKVWEEMLEEKGD